MGRRPSRGSGSPTSRRSGTRPRQRQRMWQRWRQAYRDAVSQVVPGAGDALITRLATSVGPGEPLVLARMLASDLADWPQTAWLVLEDYHHVNGPPAEAFIETLVLETPVRVFLQARRRPVWASSRRILYGEISELSRHELAMNEPEALDLLPGHLDATALIDIARGWPAVLALASVSSSPIPDLSFGAHLHQFFADEIYRRIDRDVQRDALRAGVARDARPPLVFQELPSALAQRVVQIGIDSGFLTTTDHSHLRSIHYCRSS